ncbi:cell division topological specificity factor MinE [Andreprevotia chitinilytica]|uniref:cell division topological specificity factor MinE n=1 Tax=Andreprevotia chitinilytica TaxID=396808 RepID=UPI00055549B8|nr:cell division topological specificity factor MinE [Andreprevotia chitinilytica]
MSILSYFFGEKKKTAAVARERLQIILAHERAGGRTTPDYLPQLQRELIEVISKYVSVNPEDIKVQLDKKDDFEVLEVNIVLPEAARR